MLTDFRSSARVLSTYAEYNVIVLHSIARRVTNNLLNRLQVAQDVDEPWPLEVFGKGCVNFAELLSVFCKLTTCSP